MNFTGERYIDPAMQQFRPEQLAITVEKNGSRSFTKASQPTRFGKYSEIRTRDHEFHFNLNGQIRFIRGLGRDWPHPFEALKRTEGNDWVYYSVGAAIQQKGIREQIRNLKDFHGRNLQNYNALFLGNHDALAAGADRVCMAASEAFNAFDIGNANIGYPRLFVFGSVDSFLKAGDTLFENLDRLPFFTHINIGLESVDAETLAEIGKPLTVADVHAAFRKMTDVNRSYENIEVTANFLLGDTLSPYHHQSLADLLGNVSDILPGKGAVYLSPLAGQHQESDELLQSFFEIKNKSRLPVFIYLIQRL